MADEPIGTATYDNLNTLRGQLARATERYQQWRIGQQRDIHQREMELERLKVEIDQRVQQAAMAAAGTVTQLELQVEQYAQAIARAITFTENPWASQAGAVPPLGGQATASPPGPLSLP